MTDRELKKLNRQDLLQMLINQGKELRELQAKCVEYEAALSEREIKLDQAGSIAEASLQLNGVFEAAQAACAQYMENIENLSQRQEEICAKREAESWDKAKRIIEEAEKQSNTLRKETEAQCAEMLEKAKRESQEYEEAVFRKLRAFLKEHSELRDMLSAISDKDHIS